RAARMHADNLFVLGPCRHHGIDIARFEGLIERERCVLRRGEDVWTTGLAHWRYSLPCAWRARARTWSGASSRMHLKCPSGHSRWSQGLHSISILAIWATGDKGGVNRGIEDPTNATRGRPTAAAARRRPA